MKFLQNIAKKIYSRAFENFIYHSKGESIPIKINPCTLSFQNDLEISFLKEYHKDSIVQINISIIFGLFVFISFAALDYFLVPKHFLTFLIIRIGFGWTVLLLALLIINKSRNKEIAQPVLSTLIVSLSILLISFIYIASPKLDSVYYIGIILLNFWAYSFLRLRFIWASFSGILIFLVYILASLLLLNQSYHDLVISLSHIFASIVAGTAISYILEYYSRKDFLQKLMLKSSFDHNIYLNKKISASDQTLSSIEEQLMLQGKALEAAANSIVIMDKAGTIIWCNPAFLEMTGFSLDEVIGNNPRILKSGKHDNLFYQNMWSTVLKGKVWSGDIINKKKNGDLYYEEMIITPVIDNWSKQISHFIAIKQDISLRKGMEVELFENEKRLRSLFENATLGIYRSTPSGQILMANNALIKMLGFDSLEELRKTDITKIGYVKPNQRERFIEQLSINGNLIGFESEWRKKDGSIIHIRESSRLAYNEEGDAIFEGTVEDITLKKLAELNIEQSRERLQTVFDNLYDAIIINKPDGKIINANNKFLDLFNISKEEALNLYVQNITGPELSIEDLREHWQNVIDKNKTFRFDLTALRPFDNSLFDVEIFLSRINFGNEYLVLTTIKDTTEQKEAQKNLLMSQKAMEMSAAPIYWLTRNAQIRYVNKAGLNMLGYTFAELTSLKIPDIDSLWDQEYWDNIGYPRLKQTKVDHFETFHITKSGRKIPIEVSSSLVNYEGEELITAVVTDLTERKKAAQELILAKEKAEQSDRFKSEFLAGMSHEIRTPINTILNFISLIKSDLGSNISNDISSSFDMIDSGSRRLIRTIDSIINMSQLQAGAYDVRMETVNLISDILNPLVLEFKQQACKKDLTFSLEAESEELLISADHYTLTQLFVNLFDNSVKYTETGGVNVIVCSNEKSILIKVSDTGIGISKDFLPTLFEPFLQEEMGYTRSYEGNGLGLALVKKYAEINKATIKVESEKGNGSTFIITIDKVN